MPTRRSVKDFLNFVFEEKKRANARFSLRAFAARSGVSPATLSECMSGKSQISIETALKLSTNLGFSDQERDYFITLVQMEMISSEELRSTFLEKLDEIESYRSHQAAQEVEELLRESEPRSSHHYFIEGRLDSRVLILLRNKATKEPIQAFYDSFISPERLVASNAYFLPNDDGTFRSYLAEVRAGAREPALFCKENMSLRISFSANGFPKIHALQLKRLGTSQYTVADLAHSEEEIVQTGTRYDERNPTFREAVHLVYHRKHRQ